MFNSQPLTLACLELAELDCTLVDVGIYANAFFCVVVANFDDVASACRCNRLDDVRNVVAFANFDCCLANDALDVGVLEFGRVDDRKDGGALCALDCVTRLGRIFVAEERCSDFGCAFELRFGYIFHLYHNPRTINC